LKKLLNAFSVVIIVGSSLWIAMLLLGNLGRTERQRTAASAPASDPITAIIYHVEGPIGTVAEIAYSERNEAQDGGTVKLPWRQEVTAGVGHKLMVAAEQTEGTGPLWCSITARTMSGQMEVLFTSEKDLVAACVVTQTQP
jgi:hypothetical protein